MIRIRPIMFNDDCILHIFRFVDNGRDYKSWIFVSRMFHMRPDHDARIMKYSNHLLMLIRLFPCNTWDWDYVSLNPNLTIGTVRDNPDIKWNWDNISRNPATTLNIIDQNPDLPWSWEGISCNPNVTWEIIHANPDCQWDWHYVSQNPNITWDIVRSNLDYPWDWQGVSINPNITRKIVAENSTFPWNYHWMARNRGIMSGRFRNWRYEPDPDTYNDRFDIYDLSYPLTWDMSRDIVLMWDDLCGVNLPDMDMDWDELAAVPKDSRKWPRISIDPGLTWRIVQNNPDLCWSWEDISRNKFQKWSGYSLK